MLGFSLLAIKPTPETARALENWASALQGRVMPAEKIHLTLAFLGGVDPAKAIAAAKRVEGNPHAIPIETAQYWRHNKIVWAGPNETPPMLKALVDTLHYQLFKAEYILERRPFAAHITLLRKAKTPKSLPPLPKLDWPIDEFLLMRSRTSPKGSTYEPVERFPLL